MEPLTIVMSEEQLRRKREQQKAKAPPPGTSRILSRATREQRRQYAASNANNNNVPSTPLKQPSTTTPQTNETQPQPQQQQQPQQHPYANKAHVEASGDKHLQHANETAAAATSGVKKSSTISSGKQVAAAKNADANHASENDEWQTLAEELSGAGEQQESLDKCELLMRDEAFVARLRKRFANSRALMLESKLEGAAMFRDLCKIVSCLLSIEFDEDDDEGEGEDDARASKQQVTASKHSSRLINPRESARSKRTTSGNKLSSLETFCNAAEVPGLFVDLLKELLNNNNNNNNNNNTQQNHAMKTLRNVRKCEMLVVVLHKVLFIAFE